MKRTRILSILLSVCMILTCMVGLSLTASAANTLDAANLQEGSTIPAGVGIVTSGDYDSLTVDGVDYTDNGYPNDSNSDLIVTGYQTSTNGDGGTDYVITLGEPTDPGNDDEIDIIDLDVGDTIPVGTTITTATDRFTVTLIGLDGEETTEENVDTWTAPEADGVDHYVVTAKEEYNIEITAVAADNGGDENEDVVDDGDDDDDEPKRPWAEKPTYVPSGSGTPAPTDDGDKPAEEPKDNDKQEEPKDNDKQEEPKDNDNDKDNDDNDKDDVEIPNDRDTGNDGTTGIVDGSTNTNENPHTGVALGGLSVLVLAGAAMAASKKRK